MKSIFELCIKAMNESTEELVLKKSGWLQKLALDKAEVAKKQNLWGFDLLNKHPEKVASANEHFDVNMNLE